MQQSHSWSKLLIQFFQRSARPLPRTCYKCSILGVGLLTHTWISVDGGLRLCILIIHPEKSCSVTFGNKDLSQAKYSGEETQQWKGEGGWWVGSGCKNSCFSWGCFQPGDTFRQWERQRKHAVGRRCPFSCFLYKLRLASCSVWLPG